VVTAPGLPVTQVELFIGVYDAHLEAIRPQEGPLADAVWWKRDRSRLTDLQILDRDGQAHYQLLAGGPIGDSLAAFVVVGYDASDTPVAVRSHMIWTDISDDRIDRYDFVLEAAQPVPGSGDMPGVQVWGPPERPGLVASDRRDADPHACVQVDHIKELDAYKDPDTGAVPRSGMIVSKDDPDCDGLIDAAAPDFECAANEYMGSGPIKRDTLRCGLATSFPDVTNPAVAKPACAVGGGACVDGAGFDSATCDQPSAYCMPSAACLQCGTGGCNPYRPPPGTPMITCNLYYVDGAGGTSGNTFCGAAAIDLSMVLPALTIACDASRPAMLRQDRDTPWRTQYPISSGAAVLDLTATGGCTFELKPSGPVTSNTEFGATISIPIGPSNEGRGLMMPINFHVTSPPNSDCSVRSKCGTSMTVYDDPGLEACLAAPIVPGSQVLD
jgi:hypothetical protein